VQTYKIFNRVLILFYLYRWYTLVRRYFHNYFQEVCKVKAFLILKKGEKIIQNFNNKTLLLASIISWNKSFADYDPMRIIMALDGSGQIIFSS
jgi:hypothetical protein